MGSPDIPAAPPPAPPPPTMVDESVLEERRRARKRYQGMQGRQSTLLTGALGLSEPPKLGVKTLLGG